MRKLDEIFEVVKNLDDEMFQKLCNALDGYYEKGGALRLHNVAKKIGLSVDEIWAWENL